MEKLDEVVLFAKIDATLSEYEAYVAHDHILAVEGLKNETERLRADQNG